MTDVLGQPIKLGSILRHRRDGTQGVVVEIGEPGRIARHVLAVGDIAIQTGYGSYRCTNCYNDWVHVQREYTTAVERYRSFMVTPWEHDDLVSEDRAEALVMEFAAALLPFDMWEAEDSFPTCIDSVLLEIAKEMDRQHHTTSARHFLSTAGYRVPSRRPAPKLPTQGLLRLEPGGSPQSLAKALAHALNAFSAETESGTPDFILAEYLLSCLDAFNQATKNRASYNAKPNNAQP